MERIRDELFQLLAMPQAADALAECLGFGLGPWLTGGGPELFTDPRPPAKQIAAVQWILREAPPDLAALMETEPTPPRRRQEVLLWAAGLQPLAPTLDPLAAARHLALSNDERQIVARAVQQAGQAAELVAHWPAPGRLQRRLLRAASPAGPEAVLLAGAASGWTTAHAELLRRALQMHFWPEPPLLAGVEVMQIAGISPGPRVGQLIEQIEDARADGLIRTPAQAAAWLRERLRKAAAPER